MFPIVSPDFILLTGYIDIAPRQIRLFHAFILSNIECIRKGYTDPKKMINLIFLHLSVVIKNALIWKFDMYLTFQCLLID